MNDNNKIFNQGNVNANMNFNFKGDSKMNQGNPSYQGHVQGEFNQGNFNSSSSGMNKEIPKEAIKIVDDLFEESVNYQVKDNSRIHGDFNLIDNKGDNTKHENNSQELKRIESLMRNMDQLNKNGNNIHHKNQQGSQSNNAKEENSTRNVLNDRNDWGDDWDFGEFKHNDNQGTSNRADKYIDNSPFSNQINPNTNHNILITDMKLNNPQASINFSDNKQIINNPHPNLNNDLNNLDFGLLINNSSRNNKEEVKSKNNNQPGVASIMDKNKEINFDDILSNVNLKDKESVYNHDKDFGIDNNNNNNHNNYINDFYQDQEQINLKKFATNSVPNKTNKIQRGNFEFNSVQSGRVRNIKTERSNVERNVNFNLALDNDVSYGKSKMAKETKENILDRKSHVINDDNFSLHKNSANPILNKRKYLTTYMNLEEEPLNIQIQMIFEDMLMRSDDLERMRAQLMSFELDENLNQSPIGYLCGLDQTIIQTGLTRAEEYFRGIERSISGWREVLGDGNCFYRAFMFATIESMILNKDTFQLKKILYDLNIKISKTFKRKDVNIDKNIINIVFYFITDNIENNNVKEAYNVFIKAYHLYQDFDYGLIKYMRSALGEYIWENQLSIYSNENDIEIGTLLPNAYISKEGYNFKAFIEDYLLAMHNEAEKIIIYLAPIVFNVNMVIYILEGAAKTNKNLTFFQQTYSCLLGDNKLNNFSSTITLFYRFCHYDTFYTSQMIDEFTQYIPFSIYDKSKIIDASQKRIMEYTGSNCETCGRNNEFLIFSHMPGLTLCKTCLSEFINKVILKRTKNYSSEFFNNKEYYCRPIVIDRENNFALYDEDLLYVTGKTISQWFLLFLDQICMFCQSPLVEGSYFKMPCECTICAKCCEDKINKATEGKVILNNFEKAYNQTNKPTLCACGNQFDVEYAITISKSDIDLYIAQSKERHLKQAQTYCAMCRTNTAKDRELSAGPTPVNKFPIIPEEDPNIANTNHVLCKQCIFTLKGDLIRLSKQGKLSSNSKIPIKCIVCNKKVHQVELKHLKPLLKDGDGGCCVIL